MNLACLNGDFSLSGAHTFKELGMNWEHQLVGRQGEGGVRAEGGAGRVRDYAAGKGRGGAGARQHGRPALLGAAAAAGGDGGVDAGGAGRRRHQGLHDRRQGGQGVG